MRVAVGGTAYVTHVNLRPASSSLHADWTGTIKANQHRRLQLRRDHRSDSGRLGPPASPRGKTPPPRLT